MKGGSFDQAMLFRSITRYSKTLERTDYLPQVLLQASKALLGSQPWAGAVEYPLQCAEGAGRCGAARRTQIQTLRNARPQDTQGTGARLSELILDASRPVIVAGYGCIRSGAQQVVSGTQQPAADPGSLQPQGQGGHQ